MPPLLRGISPARGRAQMIDFSQNYFALFGLPQRYRFDPEELDAAYRALQRVVHPDRYAAAGDAERRIALQSSARVNEAYRALKDPVGRAQYLLSLRGIDALAETDTAFPAEVLQPELERRGRGRARQSTRDAEGRPLLPSIVRYGDRGVDVGYPAQDALVADPQNTIVSVKRLMGRGLVDLSDARRFPYRFIDAPGMVQIETRSGIRTPVEISAEILRALRRRAEAGLSGVLAGAGATLAPHLDRAQPPATKDAAPPPGL